jgi:hypothetical protein
MIIPRAGELYAQPPAGICLKCYEFGVFERVAAGITTAKLLQNNRADPG